MTLLIGTACSHSPPKRSLYTRRINPADSGEKVCRRAAASGEILPSSTAGWRSRNIAAACTSKADWYVVLRIPATRSDEGFALELLEQYDIHLHPGHFYDFRQEVGIIARKK